MAFLSSVVVSVLESGNGKMRKEILVKQLLKNGGRHVEASSLSENGEVVNILVGEGVTYDRASRAIKSAGGCLSETHVLLRADWLSCCLKACNLVDQSPYLITAPSKSDVPCSAHSTVVADTGTAKNNNTSNTAVAAVKSEGEATPCVETDDDSRSSRTGVAAAVADSTAAMAADMPLPITATVVGSGYAGRKRKSEHTVWLNADSSLSDIEGHDDGADSDDNLSQMALVHHNAKIGQQKKTATYMCEKASTESVNHNKHITDKLQELMKIHEINRDQFRVLGYRKAITALRSHPRPVETREEVQAIRGVGKRIADKVVEIIESGNLRRLDHVDPKMEVVQVFMGIWGAGPETAKKWYAEGFRTLDDIRQKATLNRQQVVGLRLYDDLNKRMPRSEVAEIEAMVSTAALAIIPGLELMTCGSYRRGKSTCGDVDILITHPDGRSHHNIFKPLLEKLHETDFLTDDLVSAEFNGDQQKYFGVCRLGPDRLHRRLDIITVPYKELPCALLYFTGSGLFNRSMRCKARHMGMSLSEHALRTGVVRRGNDKVSEGVPLPVSCEKDVFDLLGMDYLEPHERER
ncbi:DNA polymerase lambda-like [Sycon ciliatum]|uniref:DNA polymerase lambda-like n=1 Tax=Sycon ciliatum TaxID=27933 RepID=UPI0031F6C52A